MERIAQDSPRDHWPIMEVLTTYVRVNSPVSVKGSSRSSQTLQIRKGRSALNPDIQAILRVIGRRKIANDPLNRQIDLDHADLRGANLNGAKLSGAILIGAHLFHANLRGAHFSHADLRDAHLEGAHLEGAHLEKADLSTAFGLTDSQFIGTSGDKDTKLPPRVHRPDEWAKAIAYLEKDFADPLEIRVCMSQKSASQ